MSLVPTQQAIDADESDCNRPSIRLIKCEPVREIQINERPRHLHDRCGLIFSRSGPISMV